MGGISGIFSLKNRKYLSEELVVSMTRSMSHRGPHGYEHFCHDEIAFGHNHYNTFEADALRPGPIFDSDRKLAITFSGVLYNRNDLLHANQLSAETATSDLVVQLYAKHGPDCARQLDGMFAFAIYDFEKQQLVLVRDRTGEKPLYYTVYDQTFFFASEIKAFWNIPGFSPSLAKEGVFNFFHFTQAPAPFCLYAGINKLMPAHYAVIDQDFRVTTNAYWHIDFASKTKLTYAEAQNKLQHVLQASIRRAMSGDIPVAALLSGGVDSSTIVGMMKEMQPQKQLNTYTIGRQKEQNSLDPEFLRARRIAERYDTNHKVFEYTTTSFADFVHALRHYDEPVGIFDSIQQLYLMRNIMNSDQIVLSGTAADTILAAPAVFPDVRARYKRLQRPLGTDSNRKMQIDRILADTQNIIQLEQAETFMPDAMIAYARENDSASYLHPYFAMADYDDLWGAELFVEFFVYFSHISTFNDNIGMTNGVQVRAPFVDHHLLSFAATLPQHYLYKSVNGQMEHKYILKEIARQYMPEDMVYAKKIMCGEHIDWSVMMKTIWRDEVVALFELAKSELTEFLDYQRLMTYWNLFLEDKANFRQKYNFLRIIIFLIWYKENYSRRTASPGIF